MKILEKSFYSKGFEHKQVCREGDLAIYERWYKDKPDQKHWETILIGRYEDYYLAGKLILAAETYPSSSTWGTHGFTCTTREAAFKRMDKMKAELVGQKRTKKVEEKPCKKVKKK